MAKEQKQQPIVMSDNPKDIIMLDKDELQIIGNIAQLRVIVPDYICPDSDVAVYNIGVYEDETGDNYLNAELANLGTKDILGLYFRVTGYSNTGAKLGTREYSLIDLDFKSNEIMQTGYIKLFHTDIVKLRLDITRIIDKEYNSRDIKINRLAPLPKLVKISDKLDNIVIEVLGLQEDEKYFVDRLQDGFNICTCGHLRKEKCPVCGRTNAEGLDNDMNEVTERMKTTITNIVGNIDDFDKIDELEEAKTTRDRLDRHLMTIATMRGFDEVKEYGKEGLKKLDKRIAKLEKKVKRGKKPLIIALIVILIILIAAGITVYVNGGIEWVQSLFN